MADDQKPASLSAYWREASVQLVTRRVTLSRSADDPPVEVDVEEIEIAISSETPVERWDWRTGKTYDEVLSHRDGDIDLSYCTDGLPFFVDHTSGRMVGLVQPVRLDADGVLRGLVRFGSHPDASWVEADMRNKIRTKISVGYDYDVENYTEEKRGERVVRTVRGWRPLEASSVPIPADYTVGVGRSARPGARRPDSDPGTKAVQAKEHTVSDQVTTAPAAADVRAGILAEHREIAELATIHNMRDKLGDWLGQGASVAQVQKEILAALQARSAKLLADGGDKGPLEFSQKEAEAFSFVRAIRQAAEGTNGFEREVSTELYKKMGRTPTNPMSMMIPSALLGRTGKVTGQRLEVATSNAGQQLRFTDYGGFLPILRNRMYTARLGAQVLGGLRGDLSFVTQPSANTLQWGAETATPSSTNFGTGLRTMAPKNAAALTQFTRQLLAQSVESVEGLVQEDLIAIIALGLDRAVLQGSGSSQPTGLISASGVNSVTMGANGAVPTFAKLVDMETEIAIDNADVATMGYLTTPGIRGYAKQTQQFSGTNGVPIWTQTGEVGYMNGYQAWATNQMPSTLTKGTSTGTCHGIFFGDWRHAIIGEWGATELVVDPYTSAPVIIKVSAHVMADVLFRYPEAFCVMLDAKTS